MHSLKRLYIRGSVQWQRYYATGSKLVEVSQAEDTGVTTLAMASMPVNSLNLELLDAIRTSLTEAKRSGSTGIVLTSTSPTVFSAGLDIMEMYSPDLKRAREFWQTLQDTWSTLYGLDIPVAAAINGASPAGGCMLAMSCEYRAFVEGNHMIGLNETRLGIVAPEWMRRLYILTIGYRQAEVALLRGTLFAPKEALDIGLVDELVADKPNAIKKCEEYITSFPAITGNARSLTKLRLRNELLSWLKENRENDTNEFLKFIQLPKVQLGLQLYIEGLKEKRR